MSETSSRHRQSIKHDRKNFHVLIVHNQGSINSQLRQALKALGFPNISAAPSHVSALDRLNSRRITHVFYDAKDTDMPALEFTEKLLKIESQAFLIAISEQPKIDDVFSLLRAGARSFLVPPFTTDMVEQVLTLATEGPQLSDAVLNAPDRNAAFTAVILNNLYRLSVAMRQAREFPTAERDVQNYNYQLREAVEMGILFSEGSDELLRDKIIEGCINRARDASTRLGRLRKRLKKERVKGEDEMEEASPAQP